MKVPIHKATVFQSASETLNGVERVRVLCFITLLANFVFLNGQVTELNISYIGCGSAIISKVPVL